MVTASRLSLVSKIIIFFKTKMITKNLFEKINAEILKGTSEEKIKASIVGRIYNSRDVELALYALKNPPKPVPYNFPNRCIIAKDQTWFMYKLRFNPAIYESVAYPDKKIKVFTSIAWSIMSSLSDVHGNLRKPREDIVNDLLAMNYQREDINEAIDISLRDKANREVSNEATQINSYFNDDFYHISKDVKFVRYIFFTLLIMVVLVVLIILSGGAM